MDFIKEVNAFEQWTRTNYLPATSQLLWYKVFMLCNRAGWPEWITVDNLSLMSLVQIKHTHTFTECRRKLTEAGLLEFKKGTKGSPNKYRLLPLTGSSSKNELKIKNSSKNEPPIAPYTEPYSAPYTEPQTAPLYKHKQNEKKNENKGFNDDVKRAQERSVKNSLKNELYTEPHSALKNVDLKTQRAVKLYNQNIGLLSGVVCQEFIEFYEAGVDDELICKAIEQALIQEKRSWAYIRAIVSNCITQNILTASQFEINEAKRKATKTRKTEKSNKPKNYEGDIF